jgi:hypothetical protein
MKTTFIKARAGMPERELDRCHDGLGAVHSIGVLVFSGKGEAS